MWMCVRVASCCWTGQVDLRVLAEGVASWFACLDAKQQTSRGMDGSRPSERVIRQDEA